MRRRLLVGLAGLGLSALGLTGCAQAEDAARSTVEGAASDAASQAGAAAREAARQQVCRVTQDGQVSGDEAAALGAAVQAARSAGVPSAIIDPARAIANAGTKPPREAVDALKQECAKAP